jgi:hypothetical protein
MIFLPSSYLAAHCFVFLSSRMFSSNILYATRLVCSILRAQSYHPLSVQVLLHDVMGSSNSFVPYALIEVGHRPSIPDGCFDFWSLVFRARIFLLVLPRLLLITNSKQHAHYCMRVDCSETWHFGAWGEVKPNKAFLQINPWNLTTLQSSSFVSPTHSLCEY